MRLGAPSRSSGRRRGSRRLVAALRAQLAQATAEGERLHAPPRARHLAAEPDAGPRRDDDAGPRGAPPLPQGARDRRAVRRRRGGRRPSRQRARRSRSGRRRRARARRLSRTIRGAGPCTSCRRRGRPWRLRERRAGTRSECLARAGEMLERALDADPEALPAVTLLVAVRSEEGDGARSPPRALRAAFDRARCEPRRRPARHRARAPRGHRSPGPPAGGRRPSPRARRFTRARCRRFARSPITAQRWERGATPSPRSSSSLRAPASRASASRRSSIWPDVFGTRLGRPADVERVLRAALDIDPTSVDALRQLLAHRRAAGRARERDRGLARAPGRGRDRPRGAKATVLTELAELLRRAGDAPGAPRGRSSRRRRSRRTACAPVATRGVCSRARRRITLARSTPSWLVAAELERPDAAAFAALGRLEVDALGRWAEGRRATCASRSASRPECTRRALRWRAG